MHADAAQTHQRWGQLVKLAAQICDCGTAALALVNHGVPRTAATFGQIDEATRLSASAACAAVLQSRQRLIATDPDGSFFIGVPMLALSQSGSHPGEVLAVLMVAGSGDRVPAPAQIDALTTLTQLTAEQMARRLRHESERAALDTKDRLEAAARARMLRIQQEIASMQLDPTLGLEGVMAVIAERMLEVTGAEGSTIDLIEGEELVCRAGAGLSAKHLGLRMRRDASLAGAAVQSGQPVYSANVKLDPLSNAHAGRLMPEVRAVLASPLRAGQEAIGVLKLQSTRVSAFGERDHNNLQMLAESLGGIIQRYRITQQLQASERQYRMLFDSNPHPMWVSSRATRRILAVNRAASQHYGYTEAEFLQMTVRDLWLDRDVDEHEAAWKADASGNKVLTVARRHRRKDGSVIDVEISSDAILFNGEDTRLVLVHDVTLRRSAERELARVGRAQRLLSACNEALVRATSETTLLHDVCRISVEIGGYCMAWVGFARDDVDRSIVAVAHAGSGADAMKDAPLSWDAASPYGQGPAGRSIRSGEAEIVEDVSQDASYAPWLPQIRASGFRGAASLTLRDGERVFGLFYLYAPEVVKIGSDEVRLLQQLANDLAFGIVHLRAQDAQRRLQEAVLKVAAGVSASTGTAFFEQLAHNMAEALGAQAGFVARLLPAQAGEPLAARTIAAVVDGQTIPNFGYTLVGTPCERLIDADHCVISVRLREQFAGVPTLLQLGAEAYVGRRLDSTGGQPVGMLFVLFREPLHQPEFILSTLQIFAARAAAELDRQESDMQIRHQASLLDKAQDAIIVRGIDQRVLYWNQSAARMYGWRAEEVIGRSMVSALYSDASGFELASAAVMAQGEWNGEITQSRKDGSSLLVEGRWTLVRDAEGQPHSILAINTDITQRKAAEHAVQKLAFYDPLTQLPNRQLLTDRLRQALAACGRSGRGGALLFIDLDNFKTLNDTLGHDRGDLLLQQVARRLGDCVRSVDTVARLGGDEFVVMLEDLGLGVQEVSQRARTIGEKILFTLSAPYQLEGNEHQSTSSIGITRFSSQQDSVGELLKQADIAMYQAKAGGRNTLRFFDPGLQAAVTARASLEADLRLALAQSEFFLHFQPQANGQGQCTGVEALARWRHPQRGLVSPAEFIPLAEETGLILELGRQVLSQACTLLADWAEQAHTAHLTAAVNVSSRQFKHPDFVGSVIDILSRTGANPNRLKLELTESLLVDDLELIIDKMTTLKTRGVSFSLDDFGTGYSSLGYLRRLPLDQLKIDQSFVRDVLTDPNDAVIARTIIGLGQSLGLSVIAEGVESIEQREFLVAHGCPDYQGYFFSKPLPLSMLQPFLRGLGAVSIPAL